MFARSCVCRFGTISLCVQACWGRGEKKGRERCVSYSRTMRTECKFHEVEANSVGRSRVVTVSFFRVFSFQWKGCVSKPKKVCYRVIRVQREM